MNNYSKIKQLLELNTLKGVGAEHEGGEWKVFTNVNGDGELEGTYSGPTLKKCLEEGLSITPYTEQDIEEAFTEIIPIPQKPKVLKVGTKVKVLDIVKEIGNYDEWDKDTKDCVGKEDVITEVDDNAFGVYYELKVFGYMPAYAVIPVEEEKVTIQIGDNKYNKNEVEEALKNIKSIK